MKKFVFLCLAILFSMAANAQKITVTGVVTDADYYDEPIIGAAVVEVGTTNGVITDLDGCYIIEVSVDPKTELEASAISYITEVQRVGGRRVVNFQLRQDNPVIVWPQAAPDSWLFSRNRNNNKQDRED